MTKKDFELIASAINDMFLGHNDWYRSLSQVSNKFADTLASKNPRFNREKFLQACGVEVENKICRHCGKIHKKNNVFCN